NSASPRPGAPHHHPGTPSPNGQTPSRRNKPTPTQKCKTRNMPSVRLKPRNVRHASGKASSRIASPSRYTGQSRHGKCAAPSASPPPEPTPNAPDNAPPVRGRSSRIWTPAPPQTPPNGSPNGASNSGSSAKHSKPARRHSHAGTLDRRGPAQI